ncbi:NDT80 / PhoG like DNA-binding family protein [Talaromyces stipitatus ATCC 10500]|uniref:NDT80 / PhoG like DNA-binding family protein n=1 Tax=Talaromyces stipitatus (strain ATCC 10500 / CBS 375.48 / QM 6759 / NRRL 1006) TaxID=441959 RepID=B8MC62_TALSN|nr:NDT80 / PhoG like DNA-binding family protein [Talaromyces stipitatus ATCC 10500]EED18508.1 NDT80 / PhoG like DNA-binding family protein [Talaromyces stipitatus ATCC 10500]
MTRDTYPGGYALNRNAYPSPSASLSDFQRYSYSSSMPHGVGNQLDANYYVQPHRPSQSLLDAPPFGDTQPINTIVGTENQKVMPVIQAKIHKGFFQADEKWTCYRRNYFSVSCSFTLHPLLNSTYYFQGQGQRVEPIVNWAMSISAVVNQSENETRELVQHTPKRDKQSERKPEKIILRPTQPYYLSSNMTGSGPHSPMYGMTQQMDFSAYPAPAQPPHQHTFERIQFQKATANNGKRRAQQQFYNLVVELHACVSSPEGHTRWEKIAKRVSDPMVVRGRSPGHYKDERRHSSASMGDSGGRGSSGDASRGMLPSSIDHQQYSSQMQYLYDGSQPGDSHYNHGRDMPRHSYQHFGQANHSADAISPLVSTSDGSLEFIFPDSLAGHDSTDGLPHGGGRYPHHHNDDDSSFRRDSGSSGSSSSTQSHVPSLDLSSNSGTLDDAFDPMIASYHSDEQEDVSEQYSKHSNADRCPLASIVNDSSQCSRNGGAGGTGGGSFSRFIDPIQEIGRYGEWEL